MPWQAIKIVLSDDDRQLLESLLRAGSAEYRDVLRAKIVLGAADGKTTGSIAKELGIAGQRSLEVARAICSGWGGGSFGSSAFGQAGKVWGCDGKAHPCQA